MDRQTDERTGNQKSFQLQLFLRNKYTVFTMGGTVALRSINNKKIPESYSPAAIYCAENVAHGLDLISSYFDFVGYKSQRKKILHMFIYWEKYKQTSIVHFN